MIPFFHALRRLSLPRTDVIGRPPPSSSGGFGTTRRHRLEIVRPARRRAVHLVEIPRLRFGQVLQQRDRLIRDRAVDLLGDRRYACSASR